ncbi:MAG: hypothetical protein A2Y12_10465 [Planctomycetes bacterium GWF2_42_9]|nr:MAG: hypothetical protein A2Y12_10465 [Planctomycetes bacterium GWF2_42_9]
MRILERKASDNQYLHKDFHGALCYAIKYLDETYGQEATSQYLQQVGRENFKPLIDELKQKGLIVLERHFKSIFGLESGEAKFKLENDQLTIEVSKCPAIAHLRSNGQLFTDRYCQTTVNINQAICDSAGYECSCDYIAGPGKCVQKFWKKENAK